MNVFPTSVNYTIGDTVMVIPQIDPLWGFDYWETDSVIMMPLNTNPTDSFYVNFHDTVVLHIYELPTIEAFISGNDTICDNGKDMAEVSVSFSGVDPFTFTYKHNGIPQPSITTLLNPYVISSKNEGEYTLINFSDANEVGGISGQAFINVLEAPISAFHANPDTMNILSSESNFVDDSEGNIVNWNWNFGDNTIADFSQNPYHYFKDSAGSYTVSLIIEDDFGCKDTTFRHVIITNEYWIYIPNSFTPDNDQINDKFCISYNGIREATFLFNVYDRFSNIVYSTTNIHDLDCNNGWDGNYQETGTPLLMATYIYEIYYQDFEGWKHQDFGNLFIIR